MIRWIRDRRISTWFVLALVLALVMVGLRYHGLQEEWDRERSVAQQEVTKLERVRTQQKSQERQARARGAREVLGASTTRLAEDEEMLTSLSRTVFSWDSAKSYDSARATLKKRYGLSEDDELLTDFMPPARFTEDAEGERYTYIDTVGVTSRLSGSPQIRLRGVTGTEYRYVVLLEAKVGSTRVRTSTGRESTVSRPAMLEVTVDQDGQVSDLSARMSTTGLLVSD